MPKQTINTAWAEFSTNKISFNEDEIATGIVYKGPIVSAQLNGVVYDIYKMLDLVQRTGGLYLSNKRYYYDNIVSILVYRTDEIPELEFYRCKYEGAEGIINNPPIIEGTYNEDIQIPVFQGGAVNTVYWEACSGRAVEGAYNTKREVFDFTKKIKLITIPSFTEIDGLVKELDANLTGVIKYQRPAVVEVSPYPEIHRTQLTLDIQTHYGNTATHEQIVELVKQQFLDAKLPDNEATQNEAEAVTVEYEKTPDDETYKADVLNPAIMVVEPADERPKTTIFKVRFKGMVMRNFDGSISMINNRIGIPLPEIFFDEVYTEVQNFGEPKLFEDMNPLGLAFEYGWEGDPENKQWAIYAIPKKGLSYFSLQGNKSFLNIQIGADSAQSANTPIIVPAQENVRVNIRPKGGFTNWDEIGKLQVDTSVDPDNAKEQYMRGYYLLDNSETEITENVNVVKLRYPEYGLFCKVKNYIKPDDVGYRDSGLTPPAAAGAFFRNMGEHKLPNYNVRQNNLPVIRESGKLQRDAIRNITGSHSFMNWGGNVRGVFATSTYRGQTGGHGISVLDVTLDASRIVPTTTYENRPYNIAYAHYIQAF